MKKVGLDLVKCCVQGVAAKAAKECIGHGGRAAVGRTVVIQERGLQRGMIVIRERGLIYL